MRLGLAIVLLITSSGCSREAGFSPLPAQAAPVVAVDPPANDCFVYFTEPRSSDFIVRDIPPQIEAGARRWTGQRPTVKCTPPHDGPWIAAIDFGFAGATLKDTGPVTITFRVNGKTLAQRRYHQPGPVELRLPVPKEWTKAGEPLTLEAELDKVFIAEADHAKLGVLITAAGFLEP